MNDVVELPLVCSFHRLDRKTGVELVLRPLVYKQRDAMPATSQRSTNRCKYGKMALERRANQREVQRKLQASNDLSGERGFFFRPPSTTHLAHIGRHPGNAQETGDHTIADHHISCHLQGEYGGDRHASGQARGEQEAKDHEESIGKGIDDAVA